MQFHTHEATEILAQTPATLYALLRGKSAAWLHARKTPESFSAVDVVGHLIHAEQTDWIPRVRIILEHGAARPFELFDRFDFQALIADRSIADLLDQFVGLRSQSLTTLAGLALTEEQLNLPGLHPEFGPVTLRNLIATWAVHDLAHIAQIVKTMAAEYRDAVGPWLAYTTIFN